MDLTKYIEAHNFTFDNVFDANSTNEEVGLKIITIYRFIYIASSH